MRVLIFVWLLLLAVAAAMSVCAAIWDTWAGDVRAMREVQSWAFPGEGLADGVRAGTTTQVLTYVSLALAVVVFVLGGRWEAAGIVVAVAVLNVLQPSLKEIIDRPRPDASDGIAVRAVYTSLSFPSGHAMSGMVVFGMWVWAIHRWTQMAQMGRWARVGRWTITAGLLVMLVLTGVCSVWLGVHWPSDVVGGWVWGLVVVVAVAWMSEVGSRRYSDSGVDVGGEH